MSSAFERLQKLAEEKRLKEKAEKPRLEIVPVNVEERPSAVSAPSAGSLVSAPSAGTQKHPIAPEKDFTKVANSIVRQIPNGVFIGKSKQMYDYLYSLSRGAIKPTRTIRVSKSNLMRGSGIKSTHTFYNNVRHLEIIGLIIITRIDGEKGGNSYEVLVPEELEGDLLNLAHLAQLGQLGHPAQKLLLAVSAETALTALGSNPTNTGVLSTPKTSFKDINTNDDESAPTFSEFVEKISAACKRITGKATSPRERKKWGILADLLILELESAARRADSISSAPAFLTEVLRRKLLIGMPNTFRRQNTNPDTVGKPSEKDNYEIKALDKQGREEALEHLKEFADSAFFTDFKQWYTKEDWDWLIVELEKAKETNTIVKKEI